ncbi:MAG: carboxypeptidase-like regulatory domain-containing protein, partial [Chitinophagaceae bacterium]
MIKTIFTTLLIFVTFFVFAQGRTVSGRVTDEKGFPLGNVSVVVKGTTSGTITKEDGTFTLQVPSRSTALVVSYIGMAEKEIAITASDSYAVTLTSGTKNNLDEVVVVGYGTQRRANVTSS